ncbi:MAG: hypothetical protein JWO38_2219, partial [Gemmataceae bacterium]|nr:hypothetical protein [Gemmataceae bacterium]
KSHAPVVSKAQVAGVVAEQGPAVVAVVSVGPDGKPMPTAVVVKTLTAGTAVGPGVEVVNLPEAIGFDGPGEYLLLLAPLRGSDKFIVVGPQPSPGYDLAAAGRPTIYRWSDAVRAQAEKLLP